MLAEFLASLFSDPVTKAVLGFFSAIGLIAAWARTWFKEDLKYQTDAATTRANTPAVMQAIAAGGLAPMSALKVDELNELFKCVERLCASMSHLANACDRHIDETRRATNAAEKQADEARRLQNVIDQASRDLQARLSAQHIPTRPQP